MKLDALQYIALMAADARSVEPVLSAVVRGLAAVRDVALARMWLVAPGDMCGTCTARAECPDRRRCLHLAASAGASLDGSEDYSRIDGSFQRIPLGVRKVGLIGASGRALLVPDDAPHDPHIARPEWAKRERIRSFAGQPLVFRGEVLGVLAVFSRAALTQREHDWLRTFADQAAVAIANARAFEELERLRKSVEAERDWLRDEVKTALSFGAIVGASEPLQHVMRQVELVAPTDANVLVLGESGTGKELIATAIHERSTRKSGPMVRVNCAAIPADLFESEFFGHARGAFTGAAHERVGRFELAAGGTLFLDEVAEIPRPLQGKLLRALQERTFERVGENRTRTVDVRVVAATNKDLAREVREGRFREDLMFRLGVFPIELPPLRARIDDVTPLAAHFLRQVCARQKREPLALTPALVRTLEEYPWPGNVRELQNVIERAVILSPKGKLRLDLALPQASFPSVTTSKHKSAVLTDAELRKLERDNLIAALTQCEGRVSGPEGAAALLGIKPTTLASRMKVMKVKPR